MGLGLNRCSVNGSSNLLAMQNSRKDEISMG